MEGSESEAVFNSLNVNPQLFVNETLNTVDDLVDDAFTFYLEQASSALKTDGTDKSEDLSKGVAHIRDMVQSVLDKRLDMWEKYCLHHCFAIPEGFSLPKTNEVPSESSISQDALCDPDLDMQLDSLQEKLAAVVKESAELSKELQGLGQQSFSSDPGVGELSEAIKLCEENSLHDIFQEMKQTASELRMKMDNMKAKRAEETHRTVTENMYNPETDPYRIQFSKGLDVEKLDAIQDFLDELKSM